MKPRLVLLVLMALMCPALVQAHLGSPDVFYDGMVGSWPTHITIRMPTVVPGRAEIIIQVQSREPVAVSFVPISARTAVSNAPPAELAEPVRGETNLFTGGLWLMTTGAYSIEVRIHGQSGEGTVQIPVNSVATAQLPLPPWLGKILVALGLILFCGAMAIVAGAAGESTLPPGVLPGKTEHRKYWIATIITGVVCGLAFGWPGIVWGLGVATTLAAEPDAGRRAAYIQSVDDFTALLGRGVLHPGIWAASKLAFVRLRERGSVVEKLDVLLK